MSEHITITHERTDDIPVIIAFLLKMRVAELIDKHFPTNGNWTGLSLGQMLVFSPLQPSALIDGFPIVIAKFWGLRNVDT